MDASELRNLLKWLGGEDGVAPKERVERALGDLLLPLLRAENLELLVPKDPSFKNFDFAARRLDDPNKHPSVAIEYKHFGHGRPAGASVVRQVLGAIASSPFDRALVISRFGFTSQACEVASQASIAVQLLDLASISDWIDRVEARKTENVERVELLIRSISHEFALLVARDPGVLDRLEWRDLERMMSRVMEGLGFETTLTPPSKDGGKDLILRCSVKNKAESYVVELKHWRAGKRVVKGAVSDFFNVILREQHAGGLFLATSGYAANVSEALTELSRQKLKLGDKSKIVLLAQTYVRADSGLWNPPTELPEVLFEGTQHLRSATGT